ncbi:MAG: DUF4846 domain-containing protein [Polyangiaceae bacterium]
MRGLHRPIGLWLCLASACDSVATPTVGQTTSRASDGNSAGLHPSSSVVALPASPSAAASGSSSSARPVASTDSASARDLASKYPWLSDTACDGPAVVGSLSDRFATPRGFRRVALTDGSFGAWLRTLPLASSEAPVLTFKGKVLHPATHENIAAVVAIDIGHADLQQCADSVIRLHAEWRWSRGDRSMSYRAAAGTMMSLESWWRGARPVADGAKLRWEPTGRPTEPSHSSFRHYLDDVFAWANTGSLSVQAKPVDVRDLTPGDFVVVAGSPGHAVLVLDMAQDDKGHRRVLLGQGYMPAQSFQVLRPNRESPWFEIEPDTDGLTTPFWPTFPWSSLRRLHP